MTLAMRDIIELFNLAKRENEPYKEILTFPIPTICQGHGWRQHVRSYIDAVEAYGPG